MNCPKCGHSTWITQNIDGDYQCMCGKVIYDFKENRCTSCGSLHTVKDGKSRGIQRRLCRDCGRSFTPMIAPNMRHSREMIKDAVLWHVKNITLKKIVVMLERKYFHTVDTGTVSKWYSKWRKNKLELEVGQ